MNQKQILTFRQLAWWITHLRRRWKEEGQYISSFQINTTHWSSLRVSEKLLHRLSRYDYDQISVRYKVRLLNAYADLPARLEVLAEKNNGQK